jgi:hypothetical protein
VGATMIGRLLRERNEGSDPFFDHPNPDDVGLDHAIGAALPKRSTSWGSSSHTLERVTPPRFLIHMISGLRCALDGGELGRASSPKGAKRRATAPEDGRSRERLGASRSVCPRDRPALCGFESGTRGIREDSFVPRTDWSLLEEDAGCANASSQPTHDG